MSEWDKGFLGGKEMERLFKVELLWGGGGNFDIGQLANQAGRYPGNHAGAGKDTHTRKHTDTQGGWEIQEKLPY